ncbi:hypothetical protein AAULH_12901 [Lactobacillus helveticus MTCC 5463]|nr:hypothetical protein AAULH_12901 [Lactobacillus helveticus MTCC 5463]
MNKIDELIKHVKDADAIVVSAGSGMSRATGLAFWYENSPLYMDNMKYFAKNMALMACPKVSIIVLNLKKSTGHFCLNFTR